MAPHRCVLEGGHPLGTEGGHPLGTDGADPLGTDGADPLGADGLRERVLRGWSESPARFREDANAEDDAARVGYRDRLLVELLQNAHDAAGSGGRVQFVLQDRELRVANTGSALTPDGLVALSTLRASAKREGASLGRFGTGFAAVPSVTDEPSILSGGAHVGWSASRTRSLLPASLDGEVRRRDGHVPVLRLPFPLPPAEVPDGFDTEVRLPLSERVSDAEVAAILEDFRPEWLLVFTAIDAVTIEISGVRRRVTAERHGDDVTVGGVRWLGATASAAGVGTGLGPEDRSGPLRASAWWPEGGWPGAVPRVLFAPTPTDEPSTLPVLVIADLPVDAHRRRTVPGPVRDAAIGVAAAAVAALAPRLPGQSVLSLLPATLPAGEVDALLREQVVTLLREAWPLPGRRVLDVTSPGVHEFLSGGVLADLLPPGWPASSAALRALGVERLDSADVVALVADAGEGRSARWWREAWEALSQLPDHEALAALPVPLLGGGLAPGPRGLLSAADVPEGLEDRLRLIDPAAAHPAQLRRGAVEAGPRELLEALRPAVEASYDDGDSALAAVVLPLLESLSDDAPAWLGDLALVDADGETAPAGELILAGSALDLALRSDAPLGVVDRSLVEEHGAEVLRRCGVGDALVVVRGDAAVADLDKGEAFLAGEERRGGHDAEAVGVRDLEWLRWPEALPLLKDLPHDAWDYVRWWAADEPVLGGLTPAEVLAADADPLLAGLYETVGGLDPDSVGGLDPASVGGVDPDSVGGVDPDSVGGVDPDSVGGVDPDVLAGLGCRSALPVEDDDVFDLLDRLGDPSRTVSREQLRSLLIHVAGLSVSGEPPLTVRAVSLDGSLVCVPPADAVLVDAPDLLPLLGSRAVVPVPLSAAAPLARLLGVPLASGLSSFEVVSEDPLECLDVEGDAVRVAWRVIGNRILSNGPEGLGRARAWRDGRWERRHAYVAAVREAPTPLSLLEDDLEA